MHGVISSSSEAKLLCKGEDYMNFLNKEHELKFLEMKQNLPERFLQDRERLAVIFLMAGNNELCSKLEPYIDWNEGFFFDEMFEKEDFSSGIRVLAKLAVVLYNNGTSLEFIDLYRYLDQTNLKLALNAANYRYNSKLSETYESRDTNSYLN